MLQTKINLKTLSIKRALASMTAGEYTAEDLARAYLDNIKLKDSELNAYLTVFDDAIDQAKKIDEKRSKGEKLGPLAGIPIAIKDVIMVKDREITGASLILKGHKATYDATAVARLREAGAVFLGITNCDEFAMGASGENSAYGPTKNPLDTTRVPGGSSSGSAVAVAGDMALVALGTDTGGSIRQPAAFCGLVGFKPSYGAVSRSGLLALCSSFDQIGPIAKCVEDAQTVFDVIAGKDELDSTTLDRKHINNPNLVTRSPSEMTLGVPVDVLIEGIDERVKDNYEKQIERAKELGYKIKEIELPSMRYAIPCYYIILPAEASSNLARYDGVRFGAHKEGENLLSDYKNTRGGGFGKEVRRRILLGTYVLSAGYYDAYYYKAMAVREKIKLDFAEAFKDVDAILMPTTAGPAFKIGEKASDPLKLYLEDIFTAPANIAGLSAISIPSGMVKEEGSPAGELPLGLQIITPAQCEDTLFAIGKHFMGE